MNTAAFGECYDQTCEDDSPAHVFDDPESHMTWRTMLMLVASCVLFYAGVIEVCRIVLGGHL